MIIKQKIGNELYIYISNNGKIELLYKRWINRGYGMVFCNTFGNFTAKDNESFKQTIKK